MTRNDHFEQGFIRVSATRFCISENVEFDRFYKVFRGFGNALRKPSLGNAFPMISKPVYDVLPQKYKDCIGLIRFPATTSVHSAKPVFPLGL